jgi:hypothetical protein
MHGSAAQTLPPAAAASHAQQAPSAGAATLSTKGALSSSASASSSRASSAKQSTRNEVRSVYLLYWYKRTCFTGTKILYSGQTVDAQ